MYWLTQPFLEKRYELWYACGKEVVIHHQLISNIFSVAVSSVSCCHFVVFSKILACDWTIGNSSADKFDHDQTSNLALIQFVDSDVKLPRHQILFCSQSAAAFLWIGSQCTRTLTVCTTIFLVYCIAEYWMLDCRQLFAPSFGILDPHLNTGLRKIK